MRKGHRLAGIREAGAQEVVLPLAAKESPDRAVGKPVEITCDGDADAIARQQIDQTQAVEPQQSLETLGL